MDGMLRTLVDQAAWGQRRYRRLLGEDNDMSLKSSWSRLAKIFILAVVALVVMGCVLAWTPVPIQAGDMATAAAGLVNTNFKAVPQAKPSTARPAAMKPTTATPSKPTAPKKPASVSPVPTTATPSKPTSAKKPASVSPSPKTNFPDGKPGRRLVVITPASHGNTGLCKFMVTAIALGWPAPIIVNWGHDPRGLGGLVPGKLSKIPGVLEYLDAALRSDASPEDALHPDDLVLILDGYDTIFQLPPDVFIRRYHEINARGDARLREEWTSTDEMDVRQTVVAGSQKMQWPSRREVYPVQPDAFPESPLPRYLYGPATDTHTESNYTKMRPRFLNGGMYAGPAGGVRRMLRRAFDNLDSWIGVGRQPVSEQGFLSVLFSEQEVWQAWRRGQDGFGETGAAKLGQKTFEYGLGLDYRQELSFVTAYSYDDAAVVALGNRTAIAEAAAHHNLSVTHGVSGVPADVEGARNPLRALEGGSKLRWEEMPLFTDLYTGTVPAMVHHCEHRFGLDRAVSWWDRQWMFPRLRELLRVEMRPPADGTLRKLVTVRTAGEGGKKGEEVSYWMPDSERTRRRPRRFEGNLTEPMRQLQLDDVCRDPDEYVYAEKHWWDEVFRDGKGGM